MPPRPRRPPRPPLTHFLCLPLLTPHSTPQLRTSLHHFTAAVTSPSVMPLSIFAPAPASATTPSIPEKAIRPLGTLHLTLGVMTLGSKERVEAAVAFLKHLDMREILRNTTPDSSAVDGTASPVPSAPNCPTTEGTGAGASGPGDGLAPLTLSLGGLHAMGSPAATAVLYAAPTDATGRLGGFCAALREVFTEAGFLVREMRPLRLHATVVNMVYAQERGRGGGGRAGEQGKIDGGAGKGIGEGGRGGGQGKRGRSMGKIDATELLREWGEWVWAEGVMVERVAVCEMGARVVAGREEEGVVYVEVGGVEMLGGREGG